MTTPREQFRTWYIRNPFATTYEIADAAERIFTGPGEAVIQGRVPEIVKANKYGRCVIVEKGSKMRFQLAINENGIRWFECGKDSFKEAENFVVCKSFSDAEKFIAKHSQAALTKAQVNL